MSVCWESKAPRSGTLKAEVPGVLGSEVSACLWEECDSEAKDKVGGSAQGASQGSFEGQNGGRSGP